MRYRVLGATDLKVSEIGLGCEGFVNQSEAFTKRMLDIALENGVNCMDLYSPAPEIRTNLGRLLRKKRPDFILEAHLCAAWKSGQYMRTREPEAVRLSFEDMLTRLQTDYIDVGMIHYVDSVADWKAIENGPVMAYALEQKAAGKIRYIGMSSHNPESALAAAESGLVDVILFSVNPCYDLLPGDEDAENLWAEQSYSRALVNMNPERAQLYETCLRRGVGITVMKAFGGGDLLSEYSPAKKTLTVNQCLHYALTRPAVATVFVGARDEKQLQESLAYELASAEERDFSTALSAFPRMSWQGHCMYCGHCAPCPKGIDVAAVTKFLNLAKAQGMVPETVREHYAVLPAKAGDCVACGQCEGRCPFGVHIRENMAKAKAMFGK